MEVLRSGGLGALEAALIPELRARVDAGAPREEAELLAVLNERSDARHARAVPASLERPSRLAERPKYSQTPDRLLQSVEHFNKHPNALGMPASASSAFRNARDRACPQTPIVAPGARYPVGDFASSAARRHPSSSARWRATRTSRRWCAPAKWIAASSRCSSRRARRLRRSTSAWRTSTRRSSTPRAVPEMSEATFATVQHVRSDQTVT